MKSIFAAAAVALVLSGCATVPPIALTNTFNPADFAWAEARGANSIRGSAVLRTVGGEARSCAGYEANLIPETPYSRERIMALYGTAGQGFQPVPGLFDSIPVFVPDPPEYASIGRRASCDVQGEFQFTNLPDGAYFVIVPIVWSVPTGRYGSEPQGGRLMKRVELAGGGVERVVLTR